MKELIYLLENKWIIRERDKDMYYAVKDSIKEFSDFLREKLGYQLIVTADFIKLEKVPGKAEPWMGIEEFDNKIDYMILCIILVFLEDKQKSEQFVLSQMTDYISANWIDNDNPVDWTRFEFRKRFIKVLKYCCDMYMIVVDDGEQSKFIDDSNADVLYENTGMSKYMMNRLWCDVFVAETYKDFEDNEYNRFEDRGAVRRNRIYRTLVMSPAMYKADGNENDLIYVKNFRGVVEQDMEKYLNASLHIHKNSAMVVMQDNRSFKNVFPDNRNISDIIALVCLIIREKYEASKEMIASGCINISYMDFELIIEECIKRYASGWSKQYRESSKEKILSEVITEMKYYRMINIDYNNERIIILPLAGKICGRYPKEFINENDTDNENQVDEDTSIDEKKGLNK